MLECMVKNILRYFKYDYIATNEVGSGGNGIDVVAERRIPSINQVDVYPVICECKAHERPIDMTDWLKFLGKVYKGTRNNCRVEGLLIALKAIEESKGLAIYNLGTGHGYSVLDVVKAFEKVNGVKVPYVIKERRPGDIATCYCNPAKAKAELGWEAKFGIEEMCRDSWHWQSQNPKGYEE